MIPSEVELHYIAVTKLSALLRGATPKYNDDFHCLNCFLKFRTKKSLNHIKEYVEINIFTVLECLLKKIYY